MLFFFFRKEKKNVSLKKKQVLRSFFFALSDVSLSLSLSLCAQTVRVLFEEKRETAIAAALLLL